jgi:hypothetical protein
MAYSVEKLAFGAEANFRFYRNAAENLRRTRRAADREGLRPEIVKRGCSLESRKLPAFYSTTIFQPNTRGEFFNRIGRLLPLRTLLPVVRRHCALPPEYNMGGFLRRYELNAFVSQSAHVNPLEQPLSLAQQDGRDSDVQLIDEAGTKILPDSVRSAANAHIHSVCCVARPVKRLVNTARDEVKCGSAFHPHGRARVMSQDESWNVIGWVVPPPAFPVHVGPGTANRSEHVSSENPGANILEASRSEVVVDPRCATVGAK